MNALLRRRPPEAGPSRSRVSASSVPSVSARQTVLDLLRTLLPSGDPLYLESLLAFYDLTEPADRVAQRIARKVFEVNAGVYPKTVDGSPTSPASRNAYLDELSCLFPDAEPAFLRQAIIAESSGSVVPKVCDKLLALQRPGAAGYPHRLKEGELLTPSDRFRTPQYSKGCLTRLCNEFPDRWKSTVRAVMAECNEDYLLSHARLSAMGKTTWIPGFISKIFQRRPTDDPAVYDVELLRDVDRLAAIRAEEVAKTDAEMSKRMNSEEYSANGQAIECGCCFDDFAFEDLVACPRAHVFCRGCVGRYVSEAVFGQQQSSAAELGGFRCMDASAGERCSALFEEDAVERCVGPDVFAKWQEKLASGLLTQARVPHLKCPWCAYAEIDGEVEDKARGIRTGPDTSGPDLVWGLLFGTFGAAILSPFSAALSFMAFVSGFLPALVIRPLVRTLSFDAEHPISRFLRMFLPAEPEPKRAPARFFKCRNPRCMKNSCLTCNREWVGLHRCHTDLGSSLRLYVEHAMTLALVRTCPRCSLQFQKSDGCNKMTCPGCGYVLCYVCRKEIGSEGYEHFCQHFRPVFGACRECTKCDLYKVEEDSRAVKEAGKRARERWMKEHPEAQGNEELSRSGL